MKIEVINTRYPDGLPNGTIMTVTHEYGRGSVDATVDGGDGFEWYVPAGMHRVIPDVKREVPDTPTTGTLAELNVKPGDVVELASVEGNEFVGTQCTIDCDGIAGSGTGLFFYPEWDATYSRSWRIISRASDEAASDDTPTAWQDMTDAEKGALLLAAHEGKEIECQQNSDGSWLVIDGCRFNADGAPYRIKPEPKRDVETVCWHKSWGFLPRRHQEATPYRITFDTIDGEPDLDSIKMEVLG